MLRNYLKIAFRNLRRHKLFSCLNIFGLALSMSVCLMVLQNIKNQLDYDTFHPHAERMYRITTKVTGREGNTFQLATTPLPLAGTLQTDYGIAEHQVRIYPGGQPKAEAAGKKIAIKNAFTDPDFFRVFGFTLQSGNPATALVEPNSIVLSKQTAEKFFAQSEALGKIVSFDNWGDFRVTGIMDRPAGNSHIDFEAYISMASVPLLEKTGKLAGNLASWNNGTAAYTYVLLRKTSRPDQLQHAVSEISAGLMKQTRVTGKEHFSFNVQPFTSIILGEEMTFELGNTGSRSKMWAEVAVAFVILLSACFNYTNLSVARSLRRGKEVGVRKVNGASRFQLFAQFIFESVLMSLLAGILAWVLLRGLLGVVSNEFNRGDALPDASLIGWFLAFVVFTGLLAGSLPAWALSSFKPADVLKNLTTIKLFGGNRFVKGLIVAQFALSLIITLFTAIFYKQFDYMARLDPGFRRNQIISFPLGNADYRLATNEIKQLNGVMQVSASSENPGKDVSGSVQISITPGQRAGAADYYYTDAAFVKNMDLQLLAGTTFPAGSHADRFVIVNQRTLTLLKMRSPAEAIGRSIWLSDTLPVTIAGVVKDFYHRGVDMPYRPLLLRFQPQEFQFLQVRTSAEMPATLPRQLETIWKKYNPGETIHLNMWRTDLFKGNSASSTTSMLGFLAFMAIAIACMGLLGMVVYTTETRRKEIGIRKVMGADVGRIVVLLSKGFLKLVVIAGCIALPVSYLLGYFFLNIFANRISPGIGLLLGGFLAILLLAVATIGTQVIKVAVANPVDSLRTE